MRTQTVLMVLAITVFGVNAALAQHHESSAGKEPKTVDLGEISFPTSAAAEAQRHFVRGVLLLHSFEYDRARRAFLDASRTAPDFALAYWGEAMTYDHPIWPENDKAGGLAALAKLAPTPAERRKKAPTEREQMYLDAVEKLYGDGDSNARAAAYADAMAELSRRFPDDLEAKAFYSLSLLALTRTTRNTENYMRAASIAEAIYEKNPKHPGALHYLIHAYDDPVHAPLGLRAARLYGSVAKGASHAQHMPSHIFFALGMWEDSIEANTASMKTARDAGQGGYHPLHWLQHSYLQLGRNDEAGKLVAIIEDDIKRNASAYARTHLAMCRATQLVETRGNVSAGVMEPVDPTGIATMSVFAGHEMAIGLENIRRKDVAAARRMLESIRSRNEAMKAVKTTDRAATNRYATVTQTDLDTVSVMEQILGAAIAFASGDRENALRMAVEAGEAEDRLVFEYGPPAIVKPAWEAAGELLLEAGRRAEAANAFRSVLKRYPNRRLSNEGLKAATGSSQLASGR
jgi:tetratricopeptide (TPR) repeat protein